MAICGRRSFLEHAQQALNRFQRYPSAFCLVIFDLDFFKRVSATCGHLAGEEVLRRFAAVLEAEKRLTTVDAGDRVYALHKLDPLHPAVLRNRL